MPLLSDPAPEDTSRSVQQYFQDNALVLTTQLNNIEPDNSFTYGNCATNCITMSGGNINITGRVYVGGNVNFNKKGSSKVITYTGNGSILAAGTVGYTASVVTSGSGSFPTNVMGVMTPNTITFNEANMDAMGLFYAQTSIISAKQTNIVGTFVSNYFDMGTNVPAIYQVPDAANHLPPGMIGQSSRWFMVVVWQKT